MERALNGVEVPIYCYGDLIGTRRVYNDRLLMFMLRNRAPARFASHAGTKGAVAPNAVGKMELERLKKQWRQEWEDEKRRNLPDEDEVTQSINDKLETMRDRWFTSMSPRTRAAYDEYIRLEKEDEDNDYLCWDDPEHPDFIKARNPISSPNPLAPPEVGEPEVLELGAIGVLRESGSL